MFLYSALPNPWHFTLFSLVDLFIQTPHLKFSGKYPAMLQLMHNNYLYKIYPPLSVARTSFTYLSELGQCRVNELAQSSSWQQKLQTQVLLVQSMKL